MAIYVPIILYLCFCDSYPNSYQFE